MCVELDSKQLEGLLHNEDGCGDREGLGVVSWLRGIARVHAHRCISYSICGFRRVQLILFHTMQCRERVAVQVHPE